MKSEDGPHFDVGRVAAWRVREQLSAHGVILCEAAEGASGGFVDFGVAAFVASWPRWTGAP